MFKEKVGESATMAMYSMYSGLADVYSTLRHPEQVRDYSVDPEDVALR